MIPSIEQIIEDLMASTISKSQAITWLHKHAENANTELRDAFAMSALSSAWKAFDEGYFTCDDGNANEDIANAAYQLADAMMKVRAKG